MHIKLTLTLLLGLFLIACQDAVDDADTAVGSYPNSKLLVETNWLADQTDDLDAK